MHALLRLLLSICAAAQMSVNCNAAFAQSEDLGDSSILLEIIRSPGTEFQNSQFAKFTCDEKSLQMDLRESKACDALETAGGSIYALKGTGNHPCTRIYDPVVALASGVWRGSQFSYRAEFGNYCLLLANIGDVFSFAEDKGEGGRRP